MLETIASWVCRLIFFPHIRRVERKVGYKLVFRDIPPRFINGVVPWDMTGIWRRFGLKVEAGTNYWTIGSIVNGVSTRYDRNAPEYQSWLGGYIVKLPPGTLWTPEDHIKLAIADQNSWLNTYGDPSPLTSAEGQAFIPKGAIQNGTYSGTLYQGDLVSHSDVGGRKKALKSRLSPFVQAAFLNLSNKSLRMRGSMMTPKGTDSPYETLQLRGYFAIFELENNAHIVLYGNGAIVPRKEGSVDTLSLVGDDLLRAMRACEIIKV